MAQDGAEFGMAYPTKEEAERGYEEWIEQHPELHSHPVRIERSPLPSDSEWAGWFWYVDAREAQSDG